MKYNYLRSTSVSLLFVAFFAVSPKAQICTLSGHRITKVEMEQFLKKQMDSLSIPGLSIAIINHNKIVYKRALGVANINTREKIDKKSIFEAASLSKPVFAYFVMKLVEKGILNLDTPLYKYMPYPDIERDERYKLITARIVLSHQTGFPNWRYFEMADSNMHIKYGDLYLKFTPGTQFSYSGEGYHYLAQVVAHLTNRDLKTLDELFQQEVAVPLGIQHAYFSGNDYVTAHMVTGHKKGVVFFKKWPTSFPNQDSSTFGAAGGLHTEAIDYAKFLIGFMNKKGLSNQGFNEILKAQVQVPKNNNVYTSDGDTAYGLGIAIRPTVYGTVYEHGGSNGNFQCHFVIDIEKKIGYVFFTNCDNGDAFNKKMYTFFTEGK
jgi:CubicO group peptidase (beta-lactamase class C family)